MLDDFLRLWLLRSVCSLGMFNPYNISAGAAVRFLIFDLVLFVSVEN